MPDFEEYKQRARFNDELRRERDQDSLSSWQHKHDISQAERERRARERSEAQAEAARIRAESAESVTREKTLTSLQLAEKAGQHAIELVKLEDELEEGKNERAVELEAQLATIRVQEQQLTTDTELYADLYRILFQGLVNVYVGQRLGQASPPSQAATDLQIAIEHDNLMKK